jgi:hypothetical protein
MSRSPEEKLLSSVIALAVDDVCLPPIKITIVETIGEKKRKKKILVLNALAESAYNFLFCNGADGYYAILDMDPSETRIRLLNQLRDSKTNRPFDVSNKPSELISRKKRIFRVNHDLFNRGNLRGNFTEFVSAKFADYIVEEVEE